MTNRFPAIPFAGKRVIAGGEGTAVHVVDRLPEQVPGTFPTGIRLPEADGNSVVFDLGTGLYLLYAHMQPGSVAVREGQRVARGDLIGLVATPATASRRTCTSR